MGSAWSSLQSKYTARVDRRSNSKTKLVDDQKAKESPNVQPGNRDNEKPSEPSIAIIGGGIIGLLVALGLIHRGIKVTIYERASKFTETSAGITVSADSRKVMRHINPCAAEAIEKVGSASEYPFIRYYDGFTPGLDEAQWQVPLEKLNYYGCLRGALLEALGREIPEEMVHFKKSLERYEETKDGRKVMLRFTDGSVVEADAVIGCDGIRSRTRQIMFGDDPSANASFQHVVSYRALLPLDGVVAALGPEKGLTHCLHVGPDAYTVTYPVANNTLCNMILFCKVPGPWANDRLQEICRRETAQQAIKEWKPDIRKVIDLLPEFPNKWAIFDMSENPARTYTSGRVCLAGDAAHASTPFLGSGAGQGIEDAAVLATTLDAALSQTGVDKGKAITAAFQAYNTMRLKRSQTVVKDSRTAGSVVMWQNAETGQDPEKCHAAIWEGYCRILDNDVDKMVERARGECLRLLALT